MGQANREDLVSFGRRLVGTFFLPGRTFASLAERPLWVDALVVVLILVSLYAYFVFPYEQKDRLRTMEANAASLKGKWGESGYAGEVERVRSQSRSLHAFLVTPLTSLFVLLFSALIVLGMGHSASTRGNYLQVFSALLHASFVDKLLGNGLRLYLISGRGSAFQTPTSLALLLSQPDASPIICAVLSQVDLFQAWTFGLFGLGLAAAFKTGLKKGLFISFALWLLKSALAVAIVILRLRSAQ
jgi:hypothetical protein